MMRVGCRTYSPRARPLCSPGASASGALKTPRSGLLGGPGTTAAVAKPTGIFFSGRLPHLPAASQRGG